jgi:hypothetical protein
MKAKLFLLALPAALALGALAAAGGVQQFCVHDTANSTGRPALLTCTGSLSVWQNDTCLTVHNVPAGSAGVFFFGRDRMDPVMIGVGKLCISGTGNVYRILPATVAGRDCCAGCNLDLKSYPAAVIQPGDTWYFQFLFADRDSGERNTSNGLAVTFVR